MSTLSPDPTHDDDVHLPLLSHSHGLNKEIDSALGEPRGELTRRAEKRCLERSVWVVVVLFLLGSTAHYSGMSSHLSQTVQEIINTHAQLQDAVDAVPSRVSVPKPLAYDAPAASFRENLLPETGYVTAFHYGGYTNQVMALFKLVYFAKLTDRVVILPDLYPEHGEGSSPPLSTFFDLPLWITSTNISMAEWVDVKQSRSRDSIKEELSCWGSGRGWQLSNYNIGTNFWHVDPVFTRPSPTFASLRLMLAQDQTAWLDSQSPAGGGGVESRAAYPDEQLVCFDHTFYWESLLFKHGQPDHSFTIEQLIPYGPVWNEVGQHLHFNQRVNDEVDRILGLVLPDAERLVEFIGLHIRQGDFVGSRVTHDLVEDFAREEAAMQDKLVQASHRDSDRRLPVIVATDSKDPDFLARLRALGWLTIDHEALGTKERLGGWWPGVLDSALLSRAVGLVGTSMSTFSYTAARRVETWQGGVSAMVEGRKG